MRIALVTEQAASSATRTAEPAASTDLPGHALRVTALGRALADLGHQVTVYARRDAAAQRGPVALAAGCTTEYLPAGPATPLAEEQFLPHLSAFSAQLAQRLRQRRPDVVHAHYWTGGLAALAATRGLDVPVVQTFHSLGSAEQRYRGTQSDSSGARARLEPAIARSVSAVLAGCSAELSDLTRLGVPRTSIRVVPSGVDTATFGPTGPVARRNPMICAIASNNPRSLVCFAIGAS